jgi:hypothetical protein
MHGSIMVQYGWRQAVAVRLLDPMSWTHGALLNDSRPQVHKGVCPGQAAHQLLSQCFQLLL